MIETSMAAVGHSESESKIIADHLMDCELRGVHFGGLPRARGTIEVTESVYQKLRDVGGG